MNSIQASGIEPGQRHLNGPQTTGRNYRNLLQPQYAIVQDNEVAVPMRDGVNLLANVLRLSEVGRYPVLVAASPYPRQIQNTDAPLGIVEAGQSDFFVPRGYVMSSRIAGAPAVQGDSSAFAMAKSAGTCTTWSNGPPRSLCRMAMSAWWHRLFRDDRDGGGGREAATPQGDYADRRNLQPFRICVGLVSSGFLTPFLSMVGMMSRRTNKLWCSKVVDTLGKIMLAAVSAGASVLIEVYANFVCDSFEGQLFTSPVLHCSISI